MRIEIGDTRTQITIGIAPDVFPAWFRFETEDGAFDLEQRKTVKDVLAACLNVRIDGLSANGALQPASIEAFEDHMRLWKYVILELRYESKVPPKQVSVVWKGDAVDGFYVFTEMDAELEAYGDMLFPSFTEEEPEFIWHRPVAQTQPPTVALPPRPEPTHYPLPLLSVLCMLSMIAAHMVWPKRWNGWLLATTVVMLAFCAVLTRKVTVDLPIPGKSAPTRPPDDEALAIFASLHRGIYAAMEGEDEAKVYDQLEENVTADLLQPLYLDIRQSMVLQEEGGAVARIRKTEIVETSVLDEREEDAPWFKVKARWRVVGRVGHWGHTHERINEYLADATIVTQDGRWKIAAIDVLEETRVDDGEEVK